MCEGSYLSEREALERRFSNRYFPMNVSLSHRYFKSLWLHRRVQV